MTILVTGATGKIGVYLVKDLIDRGAKVRVYVRNKGKAETSFAGLNVEYAEGDNADLTAFGKACVGIERLFLLSYDYGFEVQTAKVAATAGVKHIVKLSCVFASATEDYGTIMQQHGKAELDIAEALSGNVAFTFLRPHDFMENILTKIGGIKGAGAIYGNYDKTAVASISAKDIAGSAAGVLTAPIELHAGLGYTLTGPEALTGEALAAVVSEVIGKKVSYVNVDEATNISTLVSFGLPQRYALLLAYLGVTYRLRTPTGASFKTGWVKYLSGKEPQTWKEFLVEVKSVFV
ncbi:hypothetical protein HDU97_004848 [Phlyctochytrium planicorne]|nr:hypothetical protein HDU97_004848 [Phlyctochytrium planicorne]